MYEDDCPDGDRLVKRKVRFMDLPRDVRKSRLISDTDMWRYHMMDEPENNKFTYKQDYKWICYLLIVAESHISWSLMQDQYTKKYYCVKSD